MAKTKNNNRNKEKEALLPVNQSLILMRPILTQFKVLSI